MASAEDRLKMARLAIRGNPYFETSTFEIDKPGKSFTVDTVRHFREKTPSSTQLYFIVGGDNAHELNTWKDINQIIKMVTFIVVNRPGHKRRVPKGIKHISITMPGVQVSASYIRDCIRTGKSVQYFLRDNVVRYIKKKNLYRKP